MKLTRILVAEDNAMNQKVIKAILDKAQMNYVMAVDGIEAIKFYQDTSFDLVLMDCQMPGLDGLEAVAQIRDYECKHNLKRCPIVAITASAMSGDKEKYLSAGMDDFLSKPFRNSELLSKIGDWLSLKEVA